MPPSRWSKEQAATKQEYFLFFQNSLFDGDGIKFGGKGEGERL
jgi:hypothetical protein